jgi:hypothetical protein
MRLVVDATATAQLVRKLDDPNMIAVPLEQFLRRVSDAAADAASARAPSQIGIKAVLESPVAIVQTSSSGALQGLAHIVEGGRRPGAKQPPIERIRAWAASRGIAAEMAFPVARAIARRGIRGRHFMRAGRRAAQRAIPSALERMADDVGRRWA